MTPRKRGPIPLEKAWRRVKGGAGGRRIVREVLFDLLREI